MMKRATLIILALAIGLFLLALILRPVLAPRLYEKAVEARFSENAVADLGPGLHAILIGTGSPLPDPSRAGPMTAIVADGKLFVFDAGGGAVRKMGELGYAPAMVQQVFLTHLHSDHIDGLGELMLNRWAGSGAGSPLPISGPAGTDRIVAGLMQAYGPDQGFRIEHHGEEVVPASGFGGQAQVIEPGIVYDQNGVTITAFAVKHDPVSPALGYVIEHAGRKIVITGDTASFDPPDITRNADLLIAEALNPDMVKVMEDAARSAGQARLAKIFADIPEYHISPAQARKLADDMGAGQLVLTHIVPSVPNKIAEGLFLGGVDATVGSDGQVISLRPK